LNTYLLKLLDAGEQVAETGHLLISFDSFTVKCSEASTAVAFSSVSVGKAAALRRQHRLARSI
jgi:hypothetical protein